MYRSPPWLGNFALGFMVSDIWTPSDQYMTLYIFVRLYHTTQIVIYTIPNGRASIMSGIVRRPSLIPITTIFRSTTSCNRPIPVARPLHHSVVYCKFESNFILRMCLHFNVGRFRCTEDQRASTVCYQL